jgi:hypothetical protein
MSKPKVYTHGQMIEMAQKAELDVIYERTQLEIAENRNKHHVRADVINRLTSSARVTIQDLIEEKPGEPGKIQIKDLTKVPDSIARAVKKLKITNGKDGSQSVEVEIAHHLEYDQIIGKYTGLLSDKHLHLHNHPTAPNDNGKPAPEKLADLPPERIRGERARLEKEVEALSVTTTPEEEPKP